jgi:hypothetical protein
MAELVRVRNCEDRGRRGDVVFVHGLNGDPPSLLVPSGRAGEVLACLAWRRSTRRRSLVARLGDRHVEIYPELSFLVLRDDARL